MLDPILIIKGAGLLGIFGIIFAESGLLVGFFLPGDTLLFAAGMFASRGYFPIALLIIGGIIAAIIGDNVGYWTGKKLGRKLFDREDSAFFKKEHLNKAEKFYTKYGLMAIIIARFVPVVRTFAPIVAGVAQMNYRLFFIYNVVGGILWITSVSLLGYFFGPLIPDIDSLLMPIVLVIIGLSFFPFIIGIFHKLINKKKNQN